MLTRNHAIISLRDTDKSHVHVHLAVESDISISFITGVVTSVSLS